MTASCCMPIARPCANSRPALKFELPVLVAVLPAGAGAKGVTRPIWATSPPSAARSWSTSNPARSRARACSEGWPQAEAISRGRPDSAAGRAASFSRPHKHAGST